MRLMRMRLLQLLLNLQLAVENSHLRTLHWLWLLKRKNKKQKKLLLSYKNYSLMMLLLLLLALLILQLFSRKHRHMKDQEIYLLKKQFKRQKKMKNLNIQDPKLKPKKLLQK